MSESRARAIRLLASRIIGGRLAARPVLNGVDMRLHGLAACAGKRGREMLANARRTESGEFVFGRGARHGACAGVRTGAPNVREKVFAAAGRSALITPICSWTSSSQSTLGAAGNALSACSLRTRTYGRCLAETSQTSDGGEPDLSRARTELGRVPGGHTAQWRAPVYNACETLASWEEGYAIALTICS